MFVAGISVEMFTAAYNFIFFNQICEKNKK